MENHHVGICRLQQHFRNYKLSIKGLFYRISKCNEVITSILDNINNQFTIKKLSPSVYHLYITKLNSIENIIINASLNGKMSSRHIMITKAEIKINDMLGLICCADFRILFNWITNDKWDKCVPMYQESSLAEKVDFI